MCRVWGGTPGQIAMISGDCEVSGVWRGLAILAIIFLDVRIEKHAVCVGNRRWLVLLEGMARSHSNIGGMFLGKRCMGFEH